MADKIIISDLVKLENKEEIIKIGNLKELCIKENRKSFDQWLNFIIENKLHLSSEDKLIYKCMSGDVVQLETSSGTSIEDLTIGDYLTIDISDLCEKYGEVRPVYMLVNLMINAHCNESA